MRFPYGGANHERSVVRSFISNCVPNLHRVWIDDQRRWQTCEVSVLRQLLAVRICLICSSLERLPGEYASRHTFNVGVRIQVFKKLGNRFSVFKHLIRSR